MTAWIQRNRATLLWSLFLFGLAFAVRLAALLWLQPEPLRAISDAWFYRNAGEALAHGRGYIFPGHGPIPTAFWPPAYPAVLASVFLLPGRDLISANVFNVSVSALGAVFVFLLGARLWSRSVGVAAGVLYALFPSSILFSTLVLTEAMFATMVTGLMLLFVWWYQAGRSNWIAILVLGFLCGVAALLRGEGVFLLPAFAVIVWLLARSPAEAGKFAVAGAAGLALVIGVWTVRNMIEMDALIPVSTSGGVVAAIGHWGDADGGPNRRRTAEVNAYYEGEPYPDREVKAARKQLRDALDYALTHPLHELQLIPQRFWYIFREDRGVVDWVSASEVDFSSTGELRLKRLVDFYYYAVLALAIGGAVPWVRSRREGAIILLGVSAVIVGVFCLFFFGDSRFHASLVPVMCLLAAPALIEGGRWVSSWVGSPAAEAT